MGASLCLSFKGYKEASMPLSLTRRCGEKIKFIFPSDMTGADLRELLEKYLASDHSIP